MTCASALTRPLNCAGAPGIADGSSPVTAALNVAGPLMRGISTGSSGNTSSGMRPEACIRRGAPIAGQLLDVRLAVLDARAQDDVREAGLERAARG